MPVLAGMCNPPASTGVFTLQPASQRTSFAAEAMPGVR
jgi:hypothetical protein